MGGNVMIVQDSYIHSVGWHVKVFHAVDNVWADEIIDELISIGCMGDELKTAKRKLWSSEKNTGYTFSNTKLRETLIFVLPTTSGGEYWNSIDHEKNHLLQHISLATGVDPYGEEISYISGEFIRDVYNVANKLLCDCCRKKSLGYGKVW